jgi:hypothetical protein
MKHAKHSRPHRAVQIALALLVALAASTAAQGAQRQAERPAEPQRRPVPTGPSYGPVLHPQPIKSEPGAQLEQSPQAQEEKAGTNPAARPLEPDPSARAAPQAKDPAKADKRKEQKKGANRAARRSAPQQVDVVPVVALRDPRLAPPPPPQPAPLVPGPAQINSCLGGVCTDTSGATYNTGAGNAAVSSGGRLCTRSGNTMQCF